MESHGTGGQIDYRVSKLETITQTLHTEFAQQKSTISEMNAAVAALAVQVSHVDGALGDISSKLDATRTRKPDLQGVAALLTLTLVIAGLALAPLYARVDKNDKQIEQLLQTQYERTAIIERYEADREHINKSLDRIQDRMDRLLDERLELQP